MSKLSDRCYNIIDSVKGGSGKTSLSLMLALSAQNKISQLTKQDEADPNEEAMQAEERLHRTDKVDEQAAAAFGTTKGICAMLLDMDMQGSALANLLYGTATSTNSSRAELYLNDKLLTYYRDNSKEYVSYPQFAFASAGENGETRKDLLQVAVALASPKTTDRVKFRAISRLNYSSQITYSAFRSGLEKLLDELDTSKPDQTEYVFFDMPPNSNGYSDAVLEILLNKKSDLQGKYPCNYFELMSLDRGHIESSLEWFASFVKDDQNVFPDHFYFVFSNVPECIASMRLDDEAIAERVNIKDVILTMKVRISEILRDAPQEYRKRIFFVGIKYQEEYLRTCCQQNAIAVGTPKAPAFSKDLLSPIAFLLPLDGDAETGDLTEKLLRSLREEPAE